MINACLRTPPGRPHVGLCPIFLVLFFIHLRSVRIKNTHSLLWFSCCALSGLRLCSFAHLLHYYFISLSFILKRGLLFSELIRTYVKSFCPAFSRSWIFSCPQNFSLGLGNKVQGCKWRTWKWRTKFAGHKITEPEIAGHEIVGQKYSVNRDYMTLQWSVQFCCCCRLKSMPLLS